MKRKGLIIRVAVYISGMLLVIAWLFASTSIIARINNKNKIGAANFQELFSDYAKDQVYYSIGGGDPDHINYVGGIFENVSFYGWALCETQQDNSSRHTIFLLNNVKNGECYKLRSNISTRYDVPRNLPGLLNRETMDIPSPDVGIDDEFSTLGIKNGVYDLYIGCWENEENHGIVDTGLQIEKCNDSVEVYRWRGEKLSNLINVTQQDPPVGYLDIITVDGQYLNISDFSFVDGKDSSTQNVYVEFMDKQGERFQYTTKSMTRTDVAVAYKNDLYLQSGFITQIPLEDFPDGTYTVTVLVENDGEVWQSTPYTMTKSVNISLQH